DVGMIPSVVDTILFVEAGNIKTVLTLNMAVRTPSGMTEADLARPIVEVHDFVAKKLMYEIYSYGEQTVVIPVEGTQ
ncbi:MAG: ATPase, partial [Nanoarchaeota archaeon]